MHQALLVGATGLVGGQSLELMRSHPAYGRINVMVRKPTPVEDEKVNQRVVNFDALDDASYLMAVDTVFCALGTTIKTAGSKARFRTVDLEYPLQIAKIAKAKGATHFVLVSSQGANKHSSMFYPRVKGEVEQLIQDLAFPRMTILRPSLLLGDRSESRPGESAAKILMGALKFLTPKRYRPIHARTVAAAMLACDLEMSSGVRILESDQITEMASSFSTLGG